MLKNILLTGVTFLSLNLGIAKTAIEQSYVVNFDWKMDRRFGLDNNSNGMIDVPNTSAYVNPNVANGKPRFHVELYSVGSRIIFNNHVIVPDSYTWTIRDLGGQVLKTGTVNEAAATSESVIRGTPRGNWRTLLAEGVYEIELKITKRIG